MHLETHNLVFPIHHGNIYGDLSIPKETRISGICIFAHGSGSSRFSPRNQYVAHILHNHGIGTLLMDLLTQEEETEDEITARIRFDIPLLTRRVVSAIDFIKKDDRWSALPLGVFGASTGAAAALWSAKYRPHDVKCVVSRGGRPDLVPKDDLSQITVPTLFIVGGLDYQVIQMNQRAHDTLASSIKKLQIVQGATHLFEEPGTLDQAAEHAARFLKRHLGELKEE